MARRSQAVDLRFMQTVFGFDSVGAHWPESTVCIGVFDGVHLGHQAVIREAVSRARAAGRPAAAVTFDRHPMSVIAPDKKPKAVLSPRLNLAKMATQGLDICVIAVFDDAFAQISAEEFFANYLVGRLKATEMVIGHDFAFGHQRKGTPDWLAARITTHIHPPMEMDGLRISSSLVRQAIGEGRIADARRMLGGEYSLSGVVVRGQRLGTELGVPTANVLPLFDQVFPGAGIYAGRAFCEGRTYAAAISVGWRPTVPGAGYAIEAHLMDFAGGELYGREITLEFLERLRDELAFDNVEQLAEQMQMDIEGARKALIKHG